MSALLQSYLWAWIFWANLALGASAFLLVHRLTGGDWGVALRPSLEAASRTLLPLAVLFLPLLLLHRHLYPWAGDHETAYLNSPFFVARALLYLLCWLNLRGIARRLGAGAALVIFFLTSSFAAIDWIMSLDTRWVSTAFGLVLISSQGLSAMSFAVLRETRDPRIDMLPKKTRLDVGNLLLTTAVLWGYIGFFQFLVIWSGDLPEEVTWYLARSTHGWGAIIAVLAVTQLFGPLLVLLFRGSKESRAIASLTALIAFSTGVLQVYWLVVPSFGRASALPTLTDLLCFCGLALAWRVFYRRKELAYAA